MTINIEVSNVFDEIADLLELKEGNRFKIRAYRKAARTIESLTQDLNGIAKKGELKKLPGIGEAIAEKIEEILQTGTCKHREELKEGIPDGLLELLAIPGLGPKKVMEIYEELNVGGVEELERAAREHDIKDLPGMGAKTEENILRGIEEYRRHKGRIPLGKALPYAEFVIDELKKVGVDGITLAGSMRRMKDTIGDIDILVTSTRPNEIIDAFTNLDGIEEVLAKGKTKSSIIINDIHVDLRVVDRSSFGAASHYFTGSKQHNIRVRELGVKRGLKINEYGIFRGEERIGGEKEEDIFKSVGLCYIPPELREDRGEVEAAKDGKIPNLIKIGEIRGDLHVHTRWSDGKDGIREMAKKAIQRGYEYIAICDHSPAVGITGGLTEDMLMSQIGEIEGINEEFSDFRVLKGIEVDIRSDNTLDLEDGILKMLDIVVAAVHTKLSQDEEGMTERIISAMKNPNVDIIAHPTGRILGKRDPYEVDMERMMETAFQHGIILELNAQPSRLDLNDVYCKMAKEKGVKIAISTDAHDVMGMDLMRYGVATARRGWLEANDVINTSSLDDMLTDFPKGNLIHLR
jgi:DNA polymerase (family 10)